MLSGTGAKFQGFGQGVLSSNIPETVFRGQEHDVIADGSNGRVSPKKDQRNTNFHSDRK